MHRALGASAFLAIALAMPMQDAAAQDPVGGAILGGAAGAILGGAVGGGRGAAVGAIIGGASARSLRHKDNRGRAATGTTRTLVISSALTGLGSLLRQSIVQARLPSPLRLLPHRRPDITTSWAIG